jgi:hypothetical protein
VVPAVVAVVADEVQVAVQVGCLQKGLEAALIADLLAD